VSESESVRLVQAASLEFYPAVAETMTEAGARDERFGADLVGRAARLAVAAWARAVDGDEAALAGMDPDNAYFLLHPPYEGWQVAPGPRVTRIEVTRLNTETRATQIPVKGYETECGQAFITASSRPAWRLPPSTSPAWARPLRTRTPTTGR